jgi:hypothetical protein
VVGQARCLGAQAPQVSCICVCCVSAGNSTLNTTGGLLLLLMVLVHLLSPLGDRSMLHPSLMDWVPAYNL